MPYVWTEPEAVVDHQGVQVYHTYNGEHASQYWYTTLDSDDDYGSPLEDGGQFDVRDLPINVPYQTRSFTSPRGHRYVEIVDELDYHKRRIVANIEAGHLKAYEDTYE